MNTFYPVLRFARVRDVKAPQRAHETDAGIDFFVPDDWRPGIAECSKIISPGESALIPSGVHVDVPRGWALIFFNKSGVASKKQLDVLACVVDCGYHGEVHLNVVNNGSTPQTITAGDKLLQGVLLPVGQHATVEETLDNLYKEATARGAGGFGSTGG